MRFPPPDIRPQDDLTCSWLNRLKSWLLSAGVLWVTEPLTGQQTPNGWIIGLASQPTTPTGMLCYTDGAITAATPFSGSTSTAGSGSVFLCTTSGTTITKTSTTLNVLNYSPTTGGIPTGTRVWVDFDQDGNAYIVSNACTAG